MLNEFSVCSTSHTTFCGLILLLDNHTYLSELSSNEAILYPLLCTPTNFHCTYSTAFVTLFHVTLTCVHTLLIRLKALWGPRLIYYYLTGLSTWRVLNKCALN